MSHRLFSDPTDFIVRPSSRRRPSLFLGTCLVVSSFFLSACRDEGPALRPPSHPVRAADLVPYGAPELKAAARESTLLVALWATWCEPCLREIPVLSEFARRHPEVRVLGLATDDTASPIAAGRVDAILDRERPAYPQGRIRPGGEHALLTGLELAWDGILPKTFFLTSDGRAVLVEAFELETLEAAYRRLVRP
jgi:thiol-disulfide isomerase/thioredoxin